MTIALLEQDEATLAQAVPLLQLILRQAAKDCEKRCLFSTQKWLQELLVGMAPADLERTKSIPSPLHTAKSTRTSSKLNPQLEMSLAFTKQLDELHADVTYFTNRMEATPLSQEEQDIYELARCYFQSNEYDRAAHVLKHSSDPLLVFLRLYSRFMAGEKRKEEDGVDLMGPLDPCRVVNKELEQLEDELCQLYEQYKTDGFLIYLYGVVVARRCRASEKQSAINLLVESLVKYPYNWAAWLELASCLTSQDMITQVEELLPKSFVQVLFLVHVGLEIHADSEMLSKRLDCLLNLFPRSSYVQSHLALSKYSTREFEEAALLFQKVLTQDPFMLDMVDIYSNTLYVMENKTELCYLAHNCALIDKYRPETCLVIGNYYSMRGDHPKAVLYYQRALKLDRHYISAWTLMGHEYVEMKNTAAAIEAYRRAIDVKPVDYRAWYGLGQTYEVLNMSYYSIYYYQRATALRPWDSRMWVALAGNYEKLERHVEAIKCYKRALLGMEEDEASAPILFNLAQLHDKVDQMDTAAYYFKLAVAECSVKHGLPNNDLETAYLYLSEYFLNKNQTSEAELYLMHVDHTEGGKKLIKKLSN